MKLTVKSVTTKPAFPTDADGKVVERLHKTLLLAGEFDGVSIEVTASGIDGPEINALDLEVGDEADFALLPEGMRERFLESGRRADERRAATGLPVPTATATIEGGVVTKVTSPWGTKAMVTPTADVDTMTLGELTADPDAVKFPPPPAEPPVT